MRQDGERHLSIKLKLFRTEFPCESLTLFRGPLPCLILSQNWSILVNISKESTQVLSPGLSEPRAHISLHLAEALYWAARRGLLQPTASLLPRALQLLDTVARWAGIGHVTACSGLIGPAAHVTACSAVIGPCPGCGGTTGPAPRRATRWSTLAGSGRRSWSTLKIVIFNKSFYNFFVKYFEENYWTTNMGFSKIFSYKNANLQIFSILLI